MIFERKKTLGGFPIGTRPPLLFVHIPKTAGMSIRHFLANQYHAKDICPAHNWQSLVQHDVALSGYKLIQGHFGLNVRDLLPKGVRTLIVLRDPLERTLSTIRHMQRDEQFHFLHHRVKDMTVSQILRDASIADYFRNVQTGYLSAQRQPLEICNYLRNASASNADPWDIEPPADLDRAKRQLDTVEFVGICENLDGLFSNLCDEMLYHFPLFPPRINEAPPNSGHCSSGLSDEDRDLLRKVNDLDIQIYKYAQTIAPHVAAERTEFKTILRRLCAQKVYNIQTESFKIDLTDLVPGSGWWAADNADDPIRWTGPRREFSLELPMSADADFRARLRFWSPARLTRDTFRVSVNGRNQSIKIRRRRTRYDVTFVIGKDCLRQNDGVCELIFQTPSVFRPADSGGSDIRTLGVAVSTVTFDRMKNARGGFSRLWPW